MRVAGIEGRWLGAGVGLAAVVALVFFRGVLRGPAGEGAPTAVVERGPFRVTHVESGEIRATRDEKVVSPRVHGQLKITRLWPEGERVEVGDLILQFDDAEYAQEVKDDAGQLEQVKADLSKALAEQDRRDSELQAGVEQAQAALELAKISLQKAQYASPIEREERQIGVQQAERALAEAKTSLEAQAIISRVERANLELSIAHRQRNYDDALSDYERLSVHATRPGIVVYEKVRKRGTDREGKVTEGDVVWGGTSLLSLPELDSMQVLSQVGEMDVSRVAVGQEALIRLEAFPGPVFRGVVRDVAPMAAEEEDAPNVQVFEMIVDIRERDERLYPGMSASVEVVIAALEDALTIPLGAVHEGDGAKVVYRARAGGDFEPVTVTLGPDNGLTVVVATGLSEGDVVALAEPGVL